ncbi:hypothetical protein [Evansella halocellulosilytica]|uniref:hypothetical protein n=1 Tax=Evansella halocellulosilytica TaxID=2011013 RepID=UPI0015C9BFEA|nr:hypothetical protein [Evansella halocellulosilytica]
MITSTRFAPSESDIKPIEEAIKLPRTIETIHIAVINGSGDMNNGGIERECH